MPKFKKCPRCDINYIPEDKEYCEICEAEMHGIAFRAELDEEDEAELCPKCRINFLNEGETICESCAALIGVEEDEKEEKEEIVTWEKDELEEEVAVDEDDILMPDEVSLESLAEEEAWEEDEEMGDDIKLEGADALEELDELDDKFYDDTDDHDDEESEEAEEDAE